MNSSDMQWRAGMAAIAVTVMAALAHYALAGGSGWPAPAVFGILLLASWAAIRTAVKAYGTEVFAPAILPAEVSAPKGYASPQDERMAGGIAPGQAAIGAAAGEQASRIGRELRAYLPLFDRVGTEAESITTTTEEAARFLLAHLREVDQTISALLTFLESSGSNEKVVALIQDIEEHLGRNRNILSNFLEHRNRDIKDSKQRLSDLEAITSSLAKAAQGVRSIAWPDHLAGAERDHRGGPCGRRGKRFRRRRRGGEGFVASNR